MDPSERRQFRDKISELRNASAEHKRAWESALVRNRDGVVPFQLEALAALKQFLATYETDLKERLIETGSDDWGNHFEGEVGDTSIRVWIYDDTLSIVGPAVETRFEHWDYPTPQAAIAKFIEAVRSNMDTVSR